MKYSEMGKRSINYEFIDAVCLPRHNDCDGCPHHDHAGCDKAYQNISDEECEYMQNVIRKLNRCSRYDVIRKMTLDEMAALLVMGGWDCNNCDETERLSDNLLLRNERCDENCFDHCRSWLEEEPDNLWFDNINRCVEKREELG